MRVENVLAVIPARGGSKGLPGKNIRPIAGLPLLAHSIRCAAMVPGLRVVVSTDDEKIRATAIASGAEAPFVRPAELANDSAPMMPVLTHALAEMERRDNRRYDAVLLLDPTSPGRHPEDIRRAVELLSGADASITGVVACSKPTFNPFWVGVVADASGVLSPAFDTNAKYVRRQDVPPFYRICGSLYLWRRDFVESAPAAWVTEGKHLLLEVPEARSFSIDDLAEFQTAELLVANGLVEFPWLSKETS
jgi:CMP-N,N'-diacetyllegionaminic acid synthase